ECILSSASRRGEGAVPSPMPLVSMPWYKNICPGYTIQSISTASLRMKRCCPHDPMQG
ncbi:hypothetical protein PoB_001028800, partial [Plakobranchus ocellatus]